MLRVGLLYSLCLGLSACALPTPYQPAENGYGFSEEEVQQDVMRVTFRGNEHTSVDVVEDYLLLRMADLTFNRGHDYFRILDEETECQIRFDEGGDDQELDQAGFGPLSGYDFACRYLFGDGPKGEQEFVASASMTMHSGEVPEADEAVHDARTVQREFRERNG